MADRRKKKKIKWRYSCETYNFALSTPNFLEALFEFLKRRKKCRECLLRSYYVGDCEQ